MSGLDLATCSLGHYVTQNLAGVMLSERVVFNVPSDTV